MTQEGLRAQSVYKLLQSSPRAYLQPSLYLLNSLVKVPLEHQLDCTKKLDAVLRLPIEYPLDDHSEAFRQGLEGVNQHLPASDSLCAETMETYLAGVTRTKKRQSFLERARGAVRVSPGKTEFTMIARLGKIRHRHTWSAFSARYVVESTTNLIEVVVRFANAITSPGFQGPSEITSFGLQQNPRFYDRFFRLCFPDQGIEPLKPTMTIRSWKEHKRKLNLGDLELIVGPKGGVEARDIPSKVTVTRNIDSLRKDFSMIWELEDQDVVGMQWDGKLVLIETTIQSLADLD